MLIHLWHNQWMRRVILALFLGLLGIALGLLYGWKLDPVKFVDTTPASLRADYRTDYVLMVAEAFRVHHDSEIAQRQLSILGGRSAFEVSTDALAVAERASYSSADIALLQDLLRAMRAVVPMITTPGVSP